MNSFIYKFSIKPDNFTDPYANDPFKQESVFAKTCFEVMG